LTLIRDIFMTALPFLMLLPPPEVQVADADRFAAGLAAAPDHRIGALCARLDRDRLSAQIGWFWLLGVLSLPHLTFLGTGEGM
jgi:hypothetical protein